MLVLLVAYCSFFITFLGKFCYGYGLFIFVLSIERLLLHDWIRKWISNH